MLGVVFVDCQNDFMLSDGALPVPGAEKLIRRLNFLFQWANNRQAYGNIRVPVVFTQDDHDGTEPEMMKNGGPFPLHCMRGTFGQANILELPTTDYRVARKQCYDVWDSKAGNPEQMLSWISQGITSVLIAGVATDFCIRAAALGFVKCGIKVTVLSDMVMGVAKDTTEAAINEMLAVGIYLLPFEKALPMIIRNGKVG